jgi:hypothetical protein
MMWPATEPICEEPDRYAIARMRLRDAERTYAAAETGLIAARREHRDAELEYLRKRFPAQKDVIEHFATSR